MKTASQNGIEIDTSVTPDPSPESPSRNGNQYLHSLGDNIRSARARRGMSRRMLAKHSGVSERFLAQLESGVGNASILVLRQVARALDMPLEAMLPNGAIKSPDLQLTIDLLRQLDPAKLAEAHGLLRQRFVMANGDARKSRIGLIGLRGAGKSTIGKRLAEKLQLPFFELDRLIEQESGVSLGMIFDMYGQSGFRRFERRCLEELLNHEEKFVLATGGSLVSEPATYDRLLGACRTIWLRATPQDHMSRVIAQGDVRPMAQSREAMSELERILAEREQLYGKADAGVDTSGRSIEDVVNECLSLVIPSAARNPYITHESPAE